MRAWRQGARTLAVLLVLGAFVSAQQYGLIQIDWTKLGGNAVLTGNGTTGTGSARVTIASDNSAVAGFGAGATGSAVPANAAYQGEQGSSGLAGHVGCDNSVAYDASTNGSTQLVALSSGKKVYVCGFVLFSGGTVNVKFIYGTGTACVTGSTNLTPAFQLTAQTGASYGNGEGVIFNTTASQELCINTSAGVAVQALVTFAQF